MLPSSTRRARVTFICLSLGFASAAACSGAKDAPPLEVAGQDASQATEAGKAGDQARCVPGQSIECAGRGACRGFQICADDGARYLACTCEGSGDGGTATTDATSGLDDGSLTDARASDAPGGDATPSTLDGAPVDGAPVDGGPLDGGSDAEPVDATPDATLDSSTEADAEVDGGVPWADAGSADAAADAPPPIAWPDGGDLCASDCPAGATVQGEMCVAATPTCGPCQANGGTSTCVGSTCVVLCDATHADCDGSPANGCEADLLDGTSCKNCGTVCPVGQVCGESGCTDQCSAPNTIVGLKCVPPDAGAGPPPPPPPCPPGHLFCGGKCVNAQTDIANCGACGTKCPAGLHRAACLEGQCRPCGPGFSVATGNDRERWPWPRCVRGDYDNDACGGTTSCVAAGPSLFEAVCQFGTCAGGSDGVLATAYGAESYAQDADYVYWAGNYTIAKVAKSGGPEVVLAFGQPTPTAITLDATYVYWTNTGPGGGAMRVPKDGSASAAPFVGPLPAPPVHLTPQSATDATHAYSSRAVQLPPTFEGGWPNWRLDLVRVPLGGGAEELVKSEGWNAPRGTPWATPEDHGPLPPPVITATTVYWSVNAMVYVMPKAGACVLPIAAGYPYGAFHSVETLGLLLPWGDDELFVTIGYITDNGNPSSVRCQTRIRLGPRPYKTLMACNAAIGKVIMYDDAAFYYRTSGGLRRLAR